MCTIDTIILQVKFRDVIDFFLDLSKFKLRCSTLPVKKII